MYNNKAMLYKIIKLLTLSILVLGVLQLNEYPNGIVNIT